MSPLPSRRNGPRVAIVTDYLNQRGGAEWVVAVFHTMFPSAPVFTPILDRNNLWPELKGADIRVSWMQRLPGLRRHFRKYFLLYPLAVEGFDLSSYDLVLSSSCAYGKGARAGPDAVHVCYCHTPARFVWDYESYVRRVELGPAVRAVLPPLIRVMRGWDLKTAARPDVYVANSRVVARRIQSHYLRQAEVVPPPVSCGRFQIGPSPQNYFLIVARLIPYKRIDLAVEAFNQLQLPLYIVGDGPDRKALEKRAGPTVRFLGYQPDDEVARLLSECQALVFPGLEDFGITMVEANASGRPVVAYRGGGALDIVREGVTGVFFDDQSADSLAEAVVRLGKARWDPRSIREHALEFDVPVFRRRMLEILNQATGWAFDVPSERRSV
jgi:glycosyltransferase involved in cell wall biosynthesis